MSAIETCRTAALGGHVERCEACGHSRIAYNSLPQPALPQVPGRGGTGLARRARGRPAAGPLLPRGLHAPRRDRRHRLPEQGGGLRPAVPGRVRGDADHRRRSQAPRRPHRRHRRAPHLGLGDDPPPACPHDRAGRRHLARRRRAGSRCRPGFLLPVRVLSNLFRRLLLDGSPPPMPPAGSPFFGDLPP